jgi:peptide/nickel transport system substrate-binding protein
MRMAHALCSQRMIVRLRDWLSSLLLLGALLLAPMRARGATPDEYIVVRGDTLSGIASTLLGDGRRYTDIIAWTNARHESDSSYALIENPNQLEVGWKLALAAPAARAAVSAPRSIHDNTPLGAKPRGNIQEIAKLDRHTVRISFYEPQADFLAALASPVFSMHSPTAIQKWGREYLFHPVGTGPFALRRWTLADEIVLEANPHYWAAPSLPSSQAAEGERVARLIYRVLPNADARLQALQSYAIDWLYDLDAAEIEAAKSDPHWQIYRAAPTNTGFLVINADWEDAQRRQPLQDVRVRQAIAHAIDKAAIVRDLYPETALVATNWVPPHIWGDNREVPDYNYSPQRSRELLAEAGFPWGFQTELWVMPLPRSYFPDPAEVGRRIQADLRAVGIEAEIVTHEWDRYLAQVDAGQHALALLGWIPDLPDAASYLLPLFDGSTKQWAAAGIPDPRLGPLMQQIEQAPDDAARQQLLYDMCAILHGVAPGIPILHQGGAAAGRVGIANAITTTLGSWRETSYVSDTLVIGRSHDSLGLDIADEQDKESLRVGAQIFDALLSYKPGDAQPKPGLVERWEVSDDGREWTLHLRRDVSFHDGTPFDADAVLFNIQRMWDRSHPFRGGRTRAFDDFLRLFGGFRGEVAR